MAQPSTPGQKVTCFPALLPDQKFTGSAAKKSHSFNARLHRGLRIGGGSETVPEALSDRTGEPMPFNKNYIINSANLMKRTIITGLISLSAAVLLSGCLGLSLGGGNKSVSNNPTLGQQLVDLKSARDSGALNEQQYEDQKAKLLSGK